MAPADDFGDLERILGIAGRLKDLGGPDAAVPEYEIVAFFDRVG